MVHLLPFTFYLLPLFITFAKLKYSILQIFKILSTWTFLKE